MDLPNYDTASLGVHSADMLDTLLLDAIWRLIENVQSIPNLY